MNDYDKTREQLIKQLDEAYQQIAGEKVTGAKNKLEDTILYKFLKESHQRGQETEALLESSRAILAYRKFEDSSRVIFDSAKALIGATSGYVALLTDDGAENEVLFLDAGGRRCTVDPELPMPIRGLRSEAYHTLQTVYDNDFPDSAWMEFLPAGHVTLDNVLFAPLILEGKVVGLLGLANKPGGFTKNDARMAMAFGELAAIALYNSRTLGNLEKSEKHFRSVTQSAGDAIITTDECENIIFWNSMAEQLFGYSIDEVMGQALTIIIPTRFHDGHKNSFQHAVTARKLQLDGKLTELTGRRKDGSEFPMEISLALWEGGDNTFFSAIIHDLTERKQAERKLQKLNSELEQRVLERTGELTEANIRLHDSEARMRAIFESSLDAIGVSKAGVHVTANPAYLAMFGYETFEQLEDKSILDLIAPSEHARITTYVRQRLQGQPVPSAYETRGLRQDGTEFDMETSVSTYTIDDEVYSLVILRDITERKAAEEQLNNQAELLKKMFDSLDEAVFILDASTPAKVLDCNESTIRIFGYTKDEMIGKNTAFLHVDEESLAEFQKHLFLAVENRELPFHYSDFQMKRKDGSIFPSAHSVSELLHDTGERIGWVSVVSDITQRKQAEEAVHHSEARLRTFANALPDPAFILDRNGAYIEILTSQEELLYKELENLKGKSISELFPQNQANQFMEVIHKALDSQEVQTLEYELDVLAGKRWFEGRTAPMPSSVGEEELVVFVARDITERKRAEEMSQARVRLSEFAINHTTDELMQKTLDEAERLTNSKIGFFHLLDANQQTLTLQAWSTNTLSSMCSTEGKDHHYSVSAAGVWVDCIHQGQPVIHNDYASLPHQKGLPEGHATVIRELVAPIIRNDIIVAILGVGNKETDYDDTDIELVVQLADMAWDIISRKQAEVELHKSEELMALKDRFISTVSHEFRTPLAIIQTSSDLLSRYLEKLTPERREQSLNQIKEQIANLTEMIDGVLSIGRAQSGKIEFNPMPLELAPFCQSIFEQVQFADNAQHQFIFTNNVSEQSIMADGNLLKHILTNILSNAVKYSPENSQIIFELVRNGNTIIIQISDEGIGIPEEELARLFEPFHRASNVGEAEGTGLGLSIVKEYVELHGGTIEVESRIENGSTFKVILPLV